MKKRNSARLVALVVAFVLSVSSFNVFAASSSSPAQPYNKYLVKFKTETGKDKFIKDSSRA